MDIIAWIVFGLIVGLVAYYIEPTKTTGGILGSIILGIVGAVVGGFIGSSLFGIGVTGFNFTSFAVAILGSLLVLWVARYFGRA